MQRYWFILLVSFSLSYSLQAQESATKEWDLAYAGNNLWNPGLQVGYLKHGLSLQQKPLIYQARLGFYLDPQSQFNLFSFAGLQYRASMGQKNHFDIRLSPLGVFRSFYPEGYRVLDNGATEKIFLPGRWYYAPECSITFGFKLKNEKIKQVYLGPQLIFLLPYNSRALPILNFQVGLNFNSN
ncbi:MAG: hypothetical protein AB8H47_03940 [Bacteroidia bacterium]